MDICATHIPMQFLTNYITMNYYDLKELQKLIGIAIVISQRSESYSMSKWIYPSNTTSKLLCIFTVPKGSALLIGRTLAFSSRGPCFKYQRGKKIPLSFLSCDLMIAANQSVVFVWSQYD